MIAIDPPVGTIAMLRLGKSGLCGPTFGSMADTIQSLILAGHPAILMDISTLRRARTSDIAALMELAAVAVPRVVFGVFGTSGKVSQMLADTGADRVIRCFATRETALECSEFRRHRLGHVSAILLCDGPAAGFGPLAETGHGAMLDLMGCPLFEHALNLLAEVGVRSVTVLSSHATLPYARHLCQTGSSSLCLFYAKLSEGAEPMVAAARNHSAFLNTTLVMRGDTVLDCDLVAVVDEHQASGADITNVVSGSDHGSLTVVGVDAGDALRSHRTRSDAINWQEQVARAGCKVASIEADGAALRVSDARSYFRAWDLAMQGHFPRLVPNATKVGDGIWVQGNAEIPRKLQIEGRLFLGAGASVSADSRLVGSNVIMAGASAQSAYLSNSMLMPGAVAGPASWVDHMIAAPDWAIHHPSATGTPPVTAPLDGVGPRQPEVAETTPIAAAG